jgi:hypothetical protein
MIYKIEKRRRAFEENVVTNILKEEKVNSLRIIKYKDILVKCTDELIISTIAFIIKNYNYSYDMLFNLDYDNLWIKLNNDYDLRSLVDQKLKRKIKNMVLTEKYIFYSVTKVFIS